MQNWAKRGLQTALVTGGLLMLGTGIAAADENVDPDAKPSPLDGGVSVPVKVGNFSIGTPLGQKDIGTLVDKNISTGDVLEKGSAKAAPYLKGNVVAPNALVPVEATGWAVAAGGEAHNVNQSDESHAQGSGVQTSGAGDGLAGNVVAPTAVAPAQVTGIAFPLLGSATVQNTTNQDSTAGGSVATSGDSGSGSGNIVAPHAAVPMAVNNTAAGWFAGAATVDGDSTQTASAPGSRETSGADSVLSGNIASAPIAGPAHVDGTAASWGGMATNESLNTAAASAGAAGSDRDGHGYATTGGDSSVGSGNVATPQLAPLATVDCTAGAWVGKSTTACADDSSTEVGGDVVSSGDNSVVGGNIADAPVAAPWTADSNAGSWVGQSAATGSKTVLADAGGTAETSGVESTGGGNTLRPQAAAPAAVDCNAPVWGGMSTTECSTDTEALAGGDTNSYGDDSVLGGNTADAPLSPVTSGSGNAGSWIGMSDATLDNTTTSDVEGKTLTHGDDSVGGGNQVVTPVASAEDVTCVAGTWVGTAECAGDNDVESTAGGYTGTAGNDATAGGNIVTTPQAPVGEVFGVSGAWGGSATSTYSEEKDVTAGGRVAAIDDNGVISSNVVTAPWAPAVQGSNVAGAWIGSATSIVDSDTANSAGEGGTITSAKNSTLSGNIAEAPAALPADVHTVAATWGGNAIADGTHNTDSAAGGDAETTSQGSSASGNIVGAQGAGAANVYGWAASWVGNNVATSDKTLTSTAGGDTTSDGDGGQMSGNQVLANGNAIAGAFGNAGSFIAHDTADTVSATEVVSGGDAVSSGDGGSLTGNVAQADAQPLAQVFGLNPAAVGSTHNTVDQMTEGTNGGSVETSGTGGSLAGNLIDADAQAPWQVFGGEAAALGNPVNSVMHQTTMTNSGTNATNGDAGNLAGNIVNGDAQGPAQVFGMDASAAGNGVNTVSDSLSAVNGGASDTSGVAGNGSGNIVAAQGQAVPQVLGWGASALGTVAQGTTSETAVANGGNNATAGMPEQLSGYVLDPVATLNPGTFAWAGSVFGTTTNMTDNQLDTSNGGLDSSSGGHAVQIPVGFAPQINEVLIPIGGQITNVLTNESNQAIAGSSVMGLESAEGLMPASALPAMPSLPGGFARSDVPQLPVVSGLGGGLPVDSLPVGSLQDTVMLPAIDDTAVIPAVPSTLPAMPAMPSSSTLPEVNAGHPYLPALPSGYGRSDVPSVPHLGLLDGIPGVTTELPPLPAMPSAPEVGGLPATSSLPTMSSLPALPALPAMPSAPVQRDLPNAHATQVPGVSDGVEAFHANLQMPADKPQMPDAGSLSGQLPLGDLASLGQRPAMPGLDSAELSGLFGGRHML